MTIEQKAKAYDEALKKAKDMLSYKEVRREDMEYLFPELKESEDERIRKTLIDYFNTCHGDYYGELKRKDILAWLEKQVQKPVFEMKTPEESLGIDSDTYNKIVDECIYGDGEQNPADKLEPKFHKGEWIVWKDKCYKVNYNGCGYELVDQDGLSTSLEYGTINEGAHLWSIQDAKDGDVLVCNDNPFLFLKYEKDEYGLVCCSYCGISDSEYGEFAVNTNTKKYWCDIEFVNPATKEQRDTLERAMTNAGYRWDKEKLKLEKI